MDKDKHFLGFAIVEFRAPSQAMEATFALNRQKSPLRELGSVALAEQKLAADLPLHLMHEEEDTRRVLWFGNLWYATTDDIFEEFLRQHHLPFTGFFIPSECARPVIGNLPAVLTWRSGRDKKCFGHAQVEFETPEAARSALQQFAVHPPSLSGRRLIVDYSEKETLQRSAGGKEDEFVRASAPQEPSPTLFLAPVVSSVTPDDVARALGQLGAVPEWVKLTPIPGMENQCFVHAHFLSLDEARLVYDAAGRAKGDGFAPVVEVCGEEARVEYGQRMSRTHRSPRSPTLFIGNLQGLDITRQDINELVKTRLTPEAIGKEEVIRGIRICERLYTLTLARRTADRTHSASLGHRLCGLARGRTCRGSPLVA
jgi:RNA recognition motif-containing protein